MESSLLNYFPASHMSIPFFQTEHIHEKHKDIQALDPE